LNQLKEVRKVSFLSFEEIAEKIDIPEAYLQAIEEEDYAKLPQKEYMIENYIYSYADFLNVDPKLILDTYQKAKLSNPLEHPTTLLTRRGKRNPPKKTDSGGFFYFYRYYLLALAISLVLVLITWMIPTKHPVAKPVTKQEMISTPIGNQNRPVFTLKKLSKALPSSETWSVSQIDTLHVNLQFRGTVDVRISENNLKGNILVKKSLSKGESIDLKGKKWIYIQVDKPNLTLLKVNDVVIDTTVQKSSYIYEFKVVTN
jgi:cytoskeletal protein RodZ